LRHGVQSRRHNTSIPQTDRRNWYNNIALCVLLYASRSTGYTPADPSGFRIGPATIVSVTSCRREAATICPAPCDFDLWPFDLESGVRVMCDVGYPVRQTDRRQSIIA